MTTKLPYPEYLEFTHVDSRNNYSLQYSAERGDWQAFTLPDGEDSGAFYSSAMITNFIDRGLWKLIPTQEKTISVQELVERVKEDIETISVSYKTVVKYGGVTYESITSDSEALIDLVKTLKDTTDALKKYVKY